jgi:hypothetical protein
MLQSPDWSSFQKTEGGEGCDIYKLHATRTLYKPRQSPAAIDR